MPFSSVCVLRWCRSGGGTVSTVSLSVSQRVSVSRSGLLAVRRPNDGLRAPRARLYRLTHWLTGRHTDCPPRCESCRYCALRAVRWCALVAPMLSLPRNCGRQEEKSASESSEKKYRSTLRLKETNCFLVDRGRHRRRRRWKGRERGKDTDTFNSW